MAAILEASVPAPEKKDDEENNNPPNGGTLILDATCCPADIAYPQDVSLLNQAREKLEKTEEAKDVSATGPPGFSALVEKQETQRQSDSLRYP